MKAALPTLLAVAVLVLGSSLETPLTSISAARAHDVAAPQTPDPAQKAAETDDDDNATANNAPQTPAQKMQARYPQPIRVGSLIGQLVYRDAETVGYVSRVVKSQDGKIKLIIPFRPWLSWFKFDYATRPIAVPLEAVASVGPAINSLDMDRNSYLAAPTWTLKTESDVPADTIIQIAIARE